jgi:hypothetical protein
MQLELARRGQQRRARVLTHSLHLRLLLMSALRRGRARLAHAAPAHRRGASAHGVRCYGGQSTVQSDPPAPRLHQRRRDQPSFIL